MSAEEIYRAAAPSQRRRVSFFPRWLGAFQILLAVLMLAPCRFAGNADETPSPAATAPSPEERSLETEAKEKKNVLILYDERPDLPGLKLLDESVAKNLGAAFGPQVNLYRECLDLTRFSEADYDEFIAQYYKRKYAHKKLDVVLAVMEPSLNFVLKHGGDIFPGVPVVFCGVEQRQLANRSLSPNVTGVYMKRDFAQTVDLALSIRPETRQIVFVAGASAYDRGLTELARADLRVLGERIPITYLTDLSLEETLDRVSKLPPNALILYSSMFVDGAGRACDPYDVASRISKQASVPIFCFASTYFGRGVIGGNVNSLENQGTKVAEIAARILQGEKPAAIPIAFAGPSTPTFDWRELQRWKISSAVLPKNSDIRFYEPNFWERDKWKLLSIGAVVVAQSAIIIILVLNRRQRRRAEAELSESEGRFRNAADAAPVMLWMSGTDKLCTFFNKAWLEFTGRTVAQELGNGWAEGVHPDDLQECLRTYTIQFDARKPFVMQYRLRSAAGMHRWVVDQGEPRYDARGSFLGYVGVCVDITELREKDRAIRQFEQRVALAAEAAHMGVWEVDLRTNELWVSDKIRELFDIDPGEEIALKDFSQRVHPEDRARRDAAIRQAIETHGSYELEFRVVQRDGTLLWLAGRAQCIRNEAGEFRRLIGVSMEVTNRKEAEELFRLAAEASPSGTMLVNADGKIVLVNTHVEELFGYKRDELIGQRVEILVPGRYAARHPDHRMQFTAKPEARAMGAGRELFGRRKDGSEFPVEIGLNPIETPRGFLVLANIFDISARKAAEAEARRHRDQIDLLSRVSLLGEMTASLAHELNQPLGAIMNNGNAAIRAIDRGNIEMDALREIIVDVVSDGQRAHDIIHNVRRMIKGDSARRRLQINEVISDVTRMVRADAAANSCAIRTSLAEGLPAVEGDRLQIQQVLVNLVSNAIAAMRDVPPNGREIEITTQRNGQGTIEISVRDRGAGISENIHGRLFEQFFTTKPEGLGMGLAIVKSIVEAHGGKIEARNNEGAGAVFLFTLPIQKEISE